MANNSDGDLGLNLLSLDGGGIIGLSSLLIIKEIMKRLQKGEQRTEPGQQLTGMKPSDYFDMIVGTGTGAISAVMLGRLNMTIDEAIVAYNRLMHAVFSKPKLTFSRDTGAYSSALLEREVKEVIRQATGNEEEKLLEGVCDSPKARCKVVVYAMSSYNITSALPVAFRSYSTSTSSACRCAIWEALRATTAHPEMFKSIEVDAESIGVKDRFVHGGLGCSNPVTHLLEEAKREYPDRRVASIVSIGSGHPKTIQVEAGGSLKDWILGRLMMTKVMEVANEMAEGSERIAEEMELRFADCDSVYYRLNVEQGVQGVTASEWERMAEVAAHTRAYLGQNRMQPKLDKLVEAISKRIPILETTQIDGRVMRSSGPRHDGVRIRSCPSPSIRFTGRGKHIEKVRMYFTLRLHWRNVFVLYGLGGAGKTQIALKCVEELQERFPHVLFIDASSDESIRISLAAAALSKNLGTTCEDTLKWAGRNGRDCLLMLDNADDPNLNIQSYFPQSSDYNVLITTRCPDFRALSDGKTAECNVSGLEERDGVELLLETARLRQDELSEADRSAMYQLLKSFDYLALAIVQSGAYIRKMQLSISQYWDKYSSRQQKVPEGSVMPSLALDGYARTVYTTWDMSLNQLSPLAQELLFLISFLHRDGILEETFERAARNIHEYHPDCSSAPDQQAIEGRIKRILSQFGDKGNWNDAFADCMFQLTSFSLITYDRPSQTYSIHPLVQGWAQLVASRQSICSQHCALLLALSIDWGKHSTDYAYKRRVLSHVNLAIDRSQTYNPNTAVRFAEVYRVTGQFADEAALWEDTIRICEQQLGTDHPRTLACMNSLAWVCQQQGNLFKAKQLQEATVAAQKQILGENHPDTLKTMHRLGWSHYQLGQPTEAEAILVKVVAVRKQVLEVNHPDTLESVDDLAAVYADQGRIAEAEALRSATLATRKRIFGEDHADTLEGMDNLASTYRQLGRLSEAETLYAAVIASRKRVLGEDHPYTLISINNLAMVYRDQSRLTEVETLYSTVVASRQRVLGEDHPDTLTSSSNLALLYRDQGRLAEAETLHATVLASQKPVLGEDHPSTLFSLHELAVVYHEQGRLSEAETLYSTVVASRQRVLGEDHPDTLTSSSNLALVYRDQGRLAEAETLYATASASRKRVQGEDHPDTLTSSSNLALLYRDQGRLSEAETLYATVAASRRRVLGEDHPDTLTSSSNLALVYRDQGRLAEAETLYATASASRKRVLGEDHPSTLFSLHELAVVYHEQGRFAEAETLYAAVVASQKRAIGEDHPSTLTSLGNLASVYCDQGRLAEAETLYGTVVAFQKRVLGEDHPNVLTSLHNLALVYYHQDRFVEAESIFREVLASRKHNLGPTHFSMIRTMESLRETYYMLSKTAEHDALQLEIDAASSSASS